MKVDLEFPYKSHVTMFMSRILSPEEVEQDKIRQIKENKAHLTKLRKALTYTSLKDKYQVWKDYYTGYDYDDFFIEIEFPDFLHNYKECIRNLIKEYGSKTE